MKFGVGGKQRLATADAVVGSFGFLVFILAGEGRFGSLLPRDVILVVVQLGAPFRVALAYFCAHAGSLHEVCVSREARARAESISWSDILGWAESVADR